MTTRTITLTFQYEKDSKGAVRYMELMADQRKVPTVADGKVGQLYVRKAALMQNATGFELAFTAEKDSKGAQRYLELLPDSERPVPTVADGKVGQLYIRKAILPANIPTTLALKVSYETPKGASFPEFVNVVLSYDDVPQSKLIKRA